MLLSILLLAQAATNPLDVTGIWYTDGQESQVEISETETGSVRGEIIWYLGHEDDVVFDEKNPDPDARDEEILGLPILEGFQRGDDKWRKGEIYDPTSGKTYRSAIYRIDAETLGVQGCVGFICRELKWQRVPSSEVMRIDRAPITATAER
ncbi:DUF2147 domain-containing protein [Parvularcula lutaonensis]|uniref:DUF2147 domain-containing protein n=1 Tax=Parvularcula lutaonensis TaxID=491923 RepID=A0ABV7MAK1_9PROT|nr:DUF2147 domain-containing protein [Parvularcula lutaonensis]GGY36215.1 hypothetical protein GCM10007148_00450 [Parvularcula lutaonensis]